MHLCRELSRPLPWILTLALIGSVVAQNESVGESSILVTTTVGIEGVYRWRHRGRPIDARATADDSPLLLRLVRQERASGEVEYEIRFIAIVPGIYDLREFLQYGVDQPADDLPPLRVEVRSLLPPDHDGALTRLEESFLDLPGTPRFWRVILVALWLVPIGIVIWRRRGRRIEGPVVVKKRPPTLADQLRPLVEAALRDDISRDQKARLEMLLLSHWRDTLGLGSFQRGEAIVRMRRHAEAGELLNTIEAWLHARADRPIDPERIQSLLERYRGVAAVESAESEASVSEGSRP